MAESVSKSWFVVFNNPSEHGYVGEPHEICERLKNEWCCTDSRSGAWAYCIKHYVGHYPVYDEDGSFLRYAHAETEEEKKLVPPDLHHIHMVLEDNVATINEIALTCGFSDQSYFSKVFSAKYGITPTDYRRGEKQ